MKQKSNAFLSITQFHKGVLLVPYYMYYTYPICQHLEHGTFADNTVITAIHEDPVTASRKLHEHLTTIEKCGKSRLTNLNFPIQHSLFEKEMVNEICIPQTETVKYLGLYLDTKLTWKAYTTKKKKTN